MIDKEDIPRLSRLTAILTILQSGKAITAAELAEKFSVSKRTAYRDLKALERAGVPVFSEEGKGFSLVDGFRLPPIMFTEEEANALITAEKLIDSGKDNSLIKNHKEAIAKIKAVLRYSSKEKTHLLGERIVVFNNYQKEITSNSLASVQMAITHNQLIKINYHSIGKGETTCRTIEPYALYKTKENWILIAWCKLRDNYREFRLDRIDTYQIMPEKFKDRDFELMEYFRMIYQYDQNQ